MPFYTVNAAIVATQRFKSIFPLQRIIIKTKPHKEELKKLYLLLFYFLLFYSYALSNGLFYIES